MRRRKNYRSPNLLRIPYGWKSTYYTGTVDYDTLGFYLTQTNVKSGSVLPKWEEYIAAMRDATNPYDRKLSPILVGDITPVNWTFASRYLHKVDKYWFTAKSFLVGFPHFYGLHPMAVTSESASLDDVKLDALAKLAFLSKIRGVQSSFSSLTFLGELKETIGMLRHPLKGFIGATHAYRKRTKRLREALTRSLRHANKKRSARLRRELTARAVDRFTGSLASAYLQWTYGVAPLINDVKGIIETIDRLNENPKVERLRVTLKSNRWANDSPMKFAYASGQVTWMRYGVHLIEYSTRITGALKVNLDPPESHERLRSLTSFDLSQFVPTLYELLPFSFLADYFSTLGSTVNGLFTNTSELVYAAHTRKRTQLSTGICVARMPTPYGVSCPIIPAVGRAKGFSLNRVKADLSVDAFCLQITMPNLGQWINTSVLGFSLLRGSATPS